MTLGQKDIQFAENSWIYSVYGYIQLKSVHS